MPYSSGAVEGAINRLKMINVKCSAVFSGNVTGGSGSGTTTAQAAHLICYRPTNEYTLDRTCPRSAGANRGPEVADLAAESLTRCPTPGS